MVIWLAHAESVASYRFCSWAMPTQPFQCERLYYFLDRHRVRFLGFGNYGVPLLDRIMSDLSIEEGHSTTGIDRFGNGFTPSRASSFVRVERAGNAHPTGVTRLKLWAFRTLKNTISNISSDRFTHIFSLVVPLRLEILSFIYLSHDKCSPCRY
jgi:hypothetical protein